MSKVGSSPSNECGAPMDIGCKDPRFRTPDLGHPILLPSHPGIVFRTTRLNGCPPPIIHRDLRGLAFLCFQVRGLILGSGNVLRHSEVKGAAAAGIAFGPDAAAMLVDDAAA